MIPPVLELTNKNCPKRVALRQPFCRDIKEAPASIHHRCRHSQNPNPATATPGERSCFCCRAGAALGVCRLAEGVVADVEAGVAPTKEYEVCVTTEIPPSGSVEVSVAVTRVEEELSSDGVALGEDVLWLVVLVLRVVPSVEDVDETETSISWSTFRFLFFLKKKSCREREEKQVQADRCQPQAPQAMPQHGHDVVAQSAVDYKTNIDIQTEDVSDDERLGRVVPELGESEGTEEVRRVVVVVLAGGKEEESED